MVFLVGPHELESLNKEVRIVRLSPLRGLHLLSLVQAWLLKLSFGG
jgi:hypothetical protein